jgi:VIT1/CCC1 family predicted Fe2+/Mn2+ transporter
MRFELELKRPDPKRAPISAVTIGGSYIIGGLIPLVPYMLVHDIGFALADFRRRHGLCAALLRRDQGQFTGVNKIKAAAQTLLVGGLAAGAAYWLAHLFG